MSKQEMMGCRQRSSFVAPPWRVPPLEVPHECRTPWLVQGNPERDSISQGTVDGSSILCKCLRRITSCPTSFVLQRLGQVPVVEGQQGCDTSLQQAIDHAPIVIKPGLIHCSTPRCHHSRPANPQASPRNPHLHHQL